MPQIPVGTTFALRSIGSVRASDDTLTYALEIDEPYRAGLTQLGQFSHVYVLWWADQMDTDDLRSTMTTELPYAPGVTAGVFACRAEYRPNPVAVTIAPIVDVDEVRGIVTLLWIDAFDGTPVLDLKPYIPCVDRVRDVRVPEWLADWPDYLEDADEYFSEHDVDFGD